MLKQNNQSLPEHSCETLQHFVNGEPQEPVLVFFVGDVDVGDDCHISSWARSS